MQMSWQLLLSTGALNACGPFCTAGEKVIFCISNGILAGVRSSNSVDKATVLFCDTTNTENGNPSNSHHTQG